MQARDSSAHDPLIDQPSPPQTQNDSLPEELNEWLDDLQSMPIDSKDKTNTVDEPKEKPSGWLAWSYYAIYNTAVSIKNNTVYAVKHPIKTVMHIGMSLLAIATSGQAVINAGLNPSGANPEDIGPDLFARMTLTQKILTPVSAISSVIINYPLNISFFKEGYAQVVGSVKEMFSRTFPYIVPLPFLKNSLAIYIGIMAGLTAWLITQEAFSFIDTGIPAIDILIPLGVGGLSGFITTCARYLGTKRTLAVLKSLFSHDAKIQKDVVDAIQHLNPNVAFRLGDSNKIMRKAFKTYTQKHPIDIEIGEEEIQPDFNEMRFTSQEVLQLLIDRNVEKLLQEKWVFTQKDYKELNKIYQKSLSKFPEDDLLRRDYVRKKAHVLLMQKCKLTDADYEFLFTKLATYTAKLALAYQKNVPVFNEKKMYEYVLEYTRLTVINGLSLMIGLPGWLVFSQKVLDVLNSLSGHELRDHIQNNAYLIPIAAAGGAGTGAALLHVSATRECLLSLTSNIPLYLYHHPEYILLFITKLGLNYFASGSLHRVGLSTVERPDFIFSSLAPDIISQEILAYTVQTASGAVNILPFFRTLCEKPQDPHHPAIQHILQYLADPARRMISTQTAEECAASLVNSKVSFFKSRASQVAEQPSPVDEVNPVREDSISLLAN